MIMANPMYNNVQNRCQSGLLSASLTILIVILAVGSSSASESSLASSEERLGVCQPKMRKVLFQCQPGLNVLITRFAGMGGDRKLSADLGASVGPAIDEALPEYLNRIIGTEASKIGFQASMIQHKYVPCVIADHESARLIGKAWGADIVIWGAATAISDPGSSVLQRLTNAIRSLPAGSVVKIGSDNTTHAAKGATVKHGIIIDKNAEKAIFRAHLTAVRWAGLQSVIPGKVKPSSIPALYSLDVPALTPDQPLAVFHTLLGILAYQFECYQIAANLFNMISQDHSFLPAQRASLLRIIGVSQHAAGYTKEGLSSLSMAIELCPDNNCKARIHEVLGVAYLNMGDMQNALSNFQKTYAHFKKTGNFDAISSTTANLAIVYRVMGDVDKSIEQLNQVLAYVRQSGDVQGEVATLTNLGAALAHIGKYSLARQHTSQAIALSQQRHDITGEAYATLSMGTISEDNKETALSFFLTALKLFEASGHIAGQAETHLDMGELYATYDDYSTAMQHMNKALVLFEKMENHTGLARALAGMGDCQRKLDQPYKALDFYKKSLAHTDKQQDLVSKSVTLRRTAETYMHLSELKKASELLENALTIARNAHRRSEEGIIYQDLSYLSLEMKNFDASIRYGLMSIDIYQEFGNTAGVASTSNNLGMTHLFLGNFDASVKLFQKAISISPDVGHSTCKACTLLNLARAYSAQGRYEQAAEASLKASQLFLKRSPPDTGRSLSALRMVFNIALRQKKWNTARYIYKFFANSGMDKIELGRLDAQIQGQSFEQNAELTYLGLISLARGEAQETRGKVEIIAAAGIMRHKKRRDWPDCAGLVITDQTISSHNSPLQLGDVILSYNNSCMFSVDQFEQLQYQRASRHVAAYMEIRRGEATLRVQLPPSDELSFSVASF